MTNIATTEQTLQYHTLTKEIEVCLVCERELGCKHELYYTNMVCLNGSLNLKFHTEMAVDDMTDFAHNLQPLTSLSFSGQISLSGSNHGVYSRGNFCWARQ